MHSAARSAAIGPSAPAATMRVNANRGSMRGLATGVADQAAIACVNLALGLYLARNATPAQFGWFGLGQSVLLLAGGVASAAVLNPMSVLTPARAPEEARALRRGCLRLDLYLALLAALLTAAFASLWSGPGTTGASRLPFVFALSFAVPGWLLFDFSRRRAYLADMPGAARPNAAAVLLCVTLGGLALVHLLQPGALHAVCMALFGAAACAAALAAIPAGDWRAQRGEAWRAWALVRGGAMWSLIAMLFTWAHTFCYAWVLAAWEGPAAVATANAARMVVMPPMMVVTGATLALLPRLARDHAAGLRSAAEHYALRLYGTAFAAVILYVALVWSVRGSLLPAVLGPSYAHLDAPLLAWGLVLIVMVPRCALTALVQSRGRFRDFMLASAVASLIGVAAAVLGVQRFGIFAAIAAVGIAELVLAALLVPALRRGDGSP